MNTLLLVGSIPLETAAEVFETFGRPLAPHLAALPDGETGRRVDWMHIPVLDRGDDAFYAPHATLMPRGARVYLSAIHNMQRFGERLRTARKLLPQFGVAAFCGFGRMPAAEMPRVPQEHIRAMELLRSP